MPSFDIVSEADEQEVRNAVDQTNREVGNRYDFKGSDARVEQAGMVLTLFADSSFQLDQVQDVLYKKLVSRNIDLRSLESGKLQTISGDKAKKEITIQTGLDKDLAKKIVKIIKESKIKVTAAIQGDIVRVTGKKRDLLQETISLVKTSIEDFPLQYKNFRD
ncbi:MAG: YajQ family cyclic di-GMP-binding protein [Thiotrichales bacterium]